MNEPVAFGAVVVVTAATIIVGARGLRVSHTPEDFLVAARQVPPLLNASAISGEYLSAASFLGVAGLALAQGIGALWYAVGYAAGYLVLLSAVAAPLRRFGAYTIPDFAEGRLDSKILRRATTAMVLVICGFYLLPQLKGAGITLQATLGTPYAVGVITLGTVVTANIAAGGMRGITIVQAFQYWLKLSAIAVPALILLAFVHLSSLGALRAETAPTFSSRVTANFSTSATIELPKPILVRADGRIGGRRVDSTLRLPAGADLVGAGSRITFPKGAPVPRAESTAVLSGASWSEPFVHIPGQQHHRLAATLGVIIATFLGAMGLPHILVRFYTNPNGTAARRTTAVVLLLLACFYIFPAVFAVLGRLDAPGLYLSGQSDSVVLVLPRLVLPGPGGVVLGALTAAGAFAAFLSTSSGLLISMAGALSHDLLGGGVKAFRLSAGVIGTATTCVGLAVAGFPINVLVGWAFAISASSLCPLLLLGIWWSGLTWPGALAGLLAGGVASSAAVIATMAEAASRGGIQGWPAVLLGEPAIWTVPLAFAVMVSVSVLTPRHRPRDVVRKLLALHLPETVRLPPVRH